MRLRLALVIAFVFVASACSGNVFDLALGDCFDDPDSFDEVSNVPMVDCSEPHHNEVYHVFNLPDGSYPGESSVEARAESDCLGRFESFVGRDYQSSALDFGYLFPTRDTWAQGDREIVCLLYDLSGEKLTGSAQGTGV